MKNVTSCSFFVDVLHLDIEVERLFCKKARTRPVLQGRKSIEKKSAHQISNFRDGPSTSTVIGLFSFNRVPTSQLKCLRKRQKSTFLSQIFVENFFLRFSIFFDKNLRPDSCHFSFSTKIDFGPDFCRKWRKWKKWSDSFDPVLRKVIFAAIGFCPFPFFLFFPTKIRQTRIDLRKHSWNPIVDYSINWSRFGERFKWNLESRNPERT